MYHLKWEFKFERNFKKFTKGNKSLEKIILSKLIQISVNPFDTRLKTHKVTTRQLGYRYSSRVSGDLRIIWDFDQNDDLVILILTIGGHSGKSKVYK